LLAREANIRGQLSDRDLYAIETVKPVKATGSRLGNWLELDGLKSLILAVSQTEHATRNQAVVAIMAGCGLRRSEAASLVWAQWQERGGRYVIVDIQGKGNRTRSVPAPDWVGRYVEAWRIESMGLARVSARASESIFGLGDHALYYIVRDAARRAGLGDIAPHDLRRSYSKLSRDGGASLEQIQVTLGHSNIETTQRYLGTQLELRRGMACGDYIQMDGTAT
jgi:integrase